MVEVRLPPSTWHWVSKPLMVQRNLAGDFLFLISAFHARKSFTLLHFCMSYGYERHVNFARGKSGWLPE